LMIEPTISRPIIHQRSPRNPFMKPTPNYQRPTPNHSQLPTPNSQ
jgi:hypothetical protein